MMSEMAMQYGRNGTLVGKKFIEFFFPSVLMAASASLSIIIDSIIVGNLLGSSELAAMNLIMPLSLCFTAISGMFGIGCATCIPAFKGKMDGDNADRCLTLSCVAWVGCSLLGVALGIFATEPIAAFLSGDSGLAGLVAEYLKVYLLGCPFTFITLFFPHIIKADGKPRLASNVLIIANVTNLVLDVVYMGPVGMGLDGGALATITGNALGSFLYLIYVRSDGRTLKLARLQIRHLRLYSDMFKFGISSIFGQGLMFAKIWIFNMIVAATAGEAGLTAFSICTSCLSFVSLFIAGAAQTMIPMVGAFNGAGDNTAVGLSIRRALRIIILCCVIVSLLFELFPGAVMAIYGVKGGEALLIGKTAVRLFSISLTGIGFSFIFMYYVQARKMPAFSMQICALEGFVIIVPICILLSQLLGSNGIWLSYTVNEILVALFIILKAKYVVKRSKGGLHSFFMLEMPAEGTLELSVDVSDEKAVKEACQLMVAHAKDQDADGLQQALQQVFALAQYSYREKKALKKGAMVDVVLQRERITFKDMGKDHRLLERDEYTGRLEKMDRGYHSTLMIGMNYSEINILQAAGTGGNDE